LFSGVLQSFSKIERRRIQFSFKPVPKQANVGVLILHYKSDKIVTLECKEGYYVKVLKGILKESANYYREIEKEIKKRLSVLPKGSVKRRRISGKSYYYLQYRKGEKVVHKYLGKNRPDELLRRLKERKSLEGELKRVRSSTGMLEKIKKQ
jgi:hypothetical protein